MKQSVYALATNKYLFTCNDSLYLGFKNGEEMSAYFSKNTNDSDIIKIPMNSITSVKYNEEDGGIHLKYSSNNVSKKEFILFHGSEKTHPWDFANELISECQFVLLSRKRNSPITNSIFGILLIGLSLWLGFTSYEWSNEFLQRSGYVKVKNILFAQIAQFLGHEGCIILSIVASILIGYFIIFKNASKKTYSYEYSNQ